MDESPVFPEIHRERLVRRIRIVLALFVAGLVLSGLTTFFLEPGIRLLSSFVQGVPYDPAGFWIPLEHWIRRVEVAIEATASNHPLLFYGTDWLGFAHIVIAIAFIGPYRDPVRNKWVVDFGLIACAAVVPFALVAGEIRGIPWFWRLIDCSFGVLGALPLLYVRDAICLLEIANAGARPGGIEPGEGSGETRPVPGDPPGGSGAEADADEARRLAGALGQEFSRFADAMYSVAYPPSGAGDGIDQALANRESSRKAAAELRFCLEELSRRKEKDPGFVWLWLLKEKVAQSLLSLHLARRESAEPGEPVLSEGERDALLKTHPLLQNPYAAAGGRRIVEHEKWFQDIRRKVEAFAARVDEARK